MQYLYVLGASLLSILILFILTSLIGKRQMSQLSMFDYIVGITIGSTAAELSTGIEDIVSPVISLCVYAAVTILLAYISNKSLAARKVLEGKSQILMSDGKVYYDHMKKARIDMNEMLMQARIAGYFDLSKIKTVLLESNGQMSFLPYASDRPATPCDMGLVVPDDYLQLNVIIDGEIIEKALSLSGMNRQWLDKQLADNSINNIADVALACVGRDGKCSVFPKKKDEPKNS